MGNLIIGGDKIIKPIMSILPAIRWNILFANIIGSDLRPHFKSFTGAQKLRGLKLGLKHDHFQ